VVKVTSFHFMPYRELPGDAERRYRSMWVDAPWHELADAERAGDFYHQSLDELMLAAEVGFDGLGTNEHHQNPYGFMCNPNLFGAIIARLTRSNMLDVLRLEYMNTARAKGLNGPTVVLRHGLHNALIPIVTIFGLQFGALLAGTVFIETVFGRPGLGRLVVNAILNKDFPLVQGGVLVFALGYVFVNLVVDLVYAVVDPRIRYG